MVGQYAGTALSEEPSDLDLKVAWAQLGHPAGDYVKALIGLGEKVPEILEAADEEAELKKLEEKAGKSPRTFIDAIWREIPLRATRETADVLHRRVKNLFPHGIPEPHSSNGSASERECRVVDSSSRPLICRVIEYGNGGRVEILDRGGGHLHQDTLELSGWRLIDGWLRPPGGGGLPIRGRDNGEDGGIPQPVLQPTRPAI